jgi:DeoR/GlpR family transcriptional regulator of sugar metabolism
VSRLSRRFSVSEATIRRDLDALQKEKRLTRTYGGALLEYDEFFKPFHQRKTQHRLWKKRIARKTSLFIKPASTVFLDAGSTVFTIAEKIARLDIHGLTLVTNSLPVADVLSSHMNTEIHLLGGRLLPHQRVVAGTGASVSLGPWHFDLSFLSAEGMNGDGLWNSQDDISNFQRHLCGRSENAIFCLDESKLGRSAPSFLLPWDAVDQLITTASHEQLQAAGIRMDPQKWTQA